MERVVFEQRSGGGERGAIEIPGRREKTKGRGPEEGARSVAEDRPGRQGSRDRHGQGDRLKKVLGLVLRIGSYCEGKGAAGRF